MTLFQLWQVKKGKWYCPECCEQYAKKGTILKLKCMIKTIIHTNNTIIVQYWQLYINNFNEMKVQEVQQLQAAQQIVTAIMSLVSEQNNIGES